MGNDDQLCLLLFHELGDSVGASTDGVGPLWWRIILLGNLAVNGPVSYELKHVCNKMDCPTIRDLGG